MNHLSSPSQSPSQQRSRRRVALLAAATLLVTAVAVAAPPVAATPSFGFTPIAPERVMDTRSGVGGTAFGPETSRTLSLASVVPSGATGVALNVTATNPSTATFLTVWPAGQPQPESSNLNVSAGETRPNAVLVGLGPDRTIEVFNHSGEIEVLVDVMGYFVGEFQGVRPARVMDTRSGRAGVRMTPEAVRTVQVAGTAGVPADAAAVAVNVTAVAATQPTFLTVFPAGTSRPDTSNLNVVEGPAATPNLVVSRIGPSGSISVYNHAGSVEAVVDVMGYFTADGTFAPGNQPTRTLDTRSGDCGTFLGPGETRRVRLFSSTPSAVALNVTAVDATEPTFLTVFPAGAPRPNTSNLNVAPGPIATPNFVMVGTGEANEIAIYNESGNVHVLVDEFGATPGSARAGSPSVCQPPTTPTTPTVPTAPTTPSTTIPDASELHTDFRILLVMGGELVDPDIRGVRSPYSRARVPGCFDDASSTDDNPTTVSLPGGTTLEYRQFATTNEVAVAPGCDSPYGSIEVTVELTSGERERRRVPLVSAVVHRDDVEMPYPVNPL